MPVAQIEDMLRLSLLTSISQVTARDLRVDNTIAAIHVYPMAKLQSPSHAARRENFRVRARSARISPTGGGMTSMLTSPSRTKSSNMSTTGCATEPVEANEGAEAARSRGNCGYRA